MNGDENRAEQIPAVLAEQLRAAASKTALFVPPSTDDAVLTRAREHFAEVRRRPHRFSRVWWTAAAACIALAAMAGLSLFERTRYEQADVDHSGQVDILDAFALARRLQQGSAAGPDVNGDGLVNKADVEAIAAQAVKLKKGRV
jgi:hypothetical protein